MAASVPVNVDARLTNDKALEVPADNILPRFLPFLPWDDQPPPPPPGAAGVGAPLQPRLLPQWAAFEAFGAPCSFDIVGPNLAHWNNIHPMIFCVNGAGWERYLSALVDAGLCNQPISGPKALAQAVMVASQAIPVPAAGTLHPLCFRAADLDPSPESFITPGVPGLPGVAFQPAVPPVRGGQGRRAVRGRPAVPGRQVVAPILALAGPAELAYVTLVPVIKLWDQSRILTVPLRDAGQSASLAYLMGVFGRLYMRQVRLDPSSSVRLVAETLTEGIRASRGNTSDARLAAALPGYLRQLLDGFPPCFARRILRDPALKLDDLDTRIAYVFGSNTDRNRIEVERIDEVQHEAPVLGTFLNLSSIITVQHSAARRLLAELLPARSRELLAVVLADLEALLLARLPSITDAVNMSATLEEALTKFLLAARSLSSSSAPSSSTSVGGGPHSITEPDVRDLNGVSLSAAVNEQSFADTWRDVRPLNLDSLKDQLEALSLCFESDSSLIHRYMTIKERWLEPKHELFQRMKGLLFLRGLYFGQALTVKSDGSFPKHAEGYSWSAAEELARDTARQGAASRSVRFSDRTQLEQFMLGDFPAMDFVNAPCGYMGIEAMLDNNTSVWLDHKHHYCTKSSLEGIKVHLMKLTVAFGYSASSRRGYTAAAWVQVYIDFMGKGQNLTGNRREEWNRLADVSFRTDLRYWKDLHAQKLFHPAPAGQRFDYILPFGTSGVSDITKRLAVTDDVVTLQMAMGIRQVDQEPLRVEGVYSQQRQPRANTPPPPDRRGASPSPSERSRSVSPAGSRDSRDSHGSRLSDIDGPPQLTGPGSRSSLVTWIQGRSSFTVGRSQGSKVLFQAQEMATHCGVPLESKCWPVLISVKIGDARLALCTEWGKPGHESATSAAHVEPNGWDAAVMRSRFSKAVKSALPSSSARPQGGSRSAKRPKQRTSSGPGGR